MIFRRVRRRGVVCMGPTVTQRTRGPARGILCARQSGRDWRGVSQEEIPCPTPSPAGPGRGFCGVGCHYGASGACGGSGGQRGGAIPVPPEADYGACGAGYEGNPVRGRGLRLRAMQRAETFELSANTPIRAFTAGCGVTSYPASAKGAGGGREGDCATNSEEILESTSSTPIEPNREIADALCFK